MTTAPPTTLMTAADLANTPDPPGGSFELRRGVLLPMRPASPKSSAVGGRVLVRLGVFIEQSNLGAYGNADAGFLIGRNPDTVRAPDAWFVAIEHIPADGIPSVFWQIAPDLAVEVLSPTDRFNAVTQKAQDYLDAGTRLVWVIDPEARTLAVFRPGQRAALFGEDGVLEGADVLPGFRVALRDVLV